MSSIFYLQYPDFIEKLNYCLGAHEHDHKRKHFLHHEVITCGICMTCIDGTSYRSYRIGTILSASQFARIRLTIL